MNTAPNVVDWLAQFTQSLTDLTTQNGGALSNFGILLLTFIATIMLIGVAVRMSSWSSHFGGYHSVSMDELKTFLFRLLFCCVIEHYWVTSLPGTSFGFNRMFSYVAAQISQILDQAQLNQRNLLLATAGHNTPIPTVFAPMEYICYFYIESLLGIASGIIFLINCSSFIFYAVAALFGPLANSVKASRLTLDTFQSTAGVVPASCGEGASPLRNDFPVSCGVGSSRVRVHFQPTAEMVPADCGSLVTIVKVSDQSLSAWKLLVFTILVPVL